MGWMDELVGLVRWMGWIDGLDGWVKLMGWMGRRL